LFLADVLRVPPPAAIVDAAGLSFAQHIVDVVCIEADAPPEARAAPTAGRCMLHGRF
jgi:hypothetical protein